ncbi:MAG: hypothetical protein HeimAB125_04560 [Candidatus Heimdallarchaeota archaeon AB_125]|nr:MAG: hypothetical protein HeimAB125_04560 [Candidatus Heimdallarchaeota archaeon AB_125]
MNTTNSEKTKSKKKLREIAEQVEEIGDFVSKIQGLLNEYLLISNVEFNKSWRSSIDKVQDMVKELTITEMKIATKLGE